MPAAPRHELADLARLIEDRCLPDLEKIVYHSEVRRELVLLSLYLAIVENAHAVGTLIRARKGRQGYPLLRSMWEASLDLELVALDDAHVDNLVLVHTEFWLRQLRAGRDGNQMVVSLGALADLDQQIRDREAELVRLKETGAGRMSVKAKCAKLGKVEEYETAYRMLSNYGHNNLQALIDQHFTEDENKRLKLVLFNETAIDDVQLLLDGALNILRNTSQIVHRHFGTNLESGYD